MYGSLGGDLEGHQLGENDGRNGNREIEKIIRHASLATQATVPRKDYELMEVQKPGTVRVKFRQGSWHSRPGFGTGYSVQPTLRWRRHHLHIVSSRLPIPHLLPLPSFIHSFPSSACFFVLFLPPTLPGIIRTYVLGPIIPFVISVTPRPWPNVCSSHPRSPWVQCPRRMKQS
jgi:hypothetical protein